MQGITIISDSEDATKTGSSRPFVVVFEAGESSERVSALVSLLSAKSRCVAIRCDSITDNSWSSLTNDLIAALKARGFRQCSFIGIGAATALLQCLYLREPKIVRTLVFIDGVCRPHATLASNLADKIESILPLGLPLRSPSRGFDSRSHLQRIRVPSLVISTARADSFLIDQSHQLNRILPSSWYYKISPGEEANKLFEIINQFQEVPAKCPQKNVSVSQAKAV